MAGIIKSTICAILAHLPTFIAFPAAAVVRRFWPGFYSA